MEIKKFPSIPNCELYLCGGAVRDYLLGKENKDEDYVVLTDLTYDELLLQLESDENVKVFKADPEFYTIRCLIEGRAIDLVFPRKEGGYSDGRHPDYVERVQTLKEDSLRRDFTVNAMYMDNKGKIIDYHHGEIHLKAKLLCTVREPRLTFKDDYLRILRGVRFACQYNFKTVAIDRDMKKYSTNLEVISMERIKDELNKSLKYNGRRAWLYISQLDLWDLLIDKGLRFEVTNKK